MLLTYLFLIYNKIQDYYGRTLIIFMGAKSNAIHVYMARQPIFNQKNKVYGYELLYRANEKNSYTADTNGDFATESVISEALFNFGLDKLTNGRRAFINFTENLLLKKTALLLDPRQFVIEILESVHLTEPILEHLALLKSKGYILALDDYDGGEISEEALSLVDIIKIDFMLTDKMQRLNCSAQLKKAGKQLLAEKIETKEDYDEALSLGCDFFQGYYFAKPTIVQKTNKDIASVSYIRLMKEMTSPDINFDRLARIIYSDVHLTYKLLRNMRTLQYYRGHTIKTVRHALVIMGLNEVRRWVMLVLMGSLMGQGADELIRTALIRALFCENMAEASHQQKLASTAFSTGMFSVIRHEETDFKEFLQNMQIESSVKEALTGQDNQLKVFLDIAVNYEAGNWNQAEALIREKALNLTSDKLIDLYVSSVQHADKLLTE